MWNPVHSSRSNATLLWSDLEWRSGAKTHLNERARKGETSHSFRVRERQSPHPCFASLLAKNKKRYVSATAETRHRSRGWEENADLQHHTEPCFSSRAVIARFIFFSGHLKVLDVPSLPTTTWKEENFLKCITEIPHIVLMCISGLISDSKLEKKDFFFYWN